MLRLPLVTALTAISFASPALGHARIKPNSSLNPRTTSSGEKTGPCGATTPTTDPTKRTTLAPGQKLVVMWEETINHPGSYRIAFSKDGINGFDNNVLLNNIPDTKDTPVNYSDPTTYHQFSATVTVPQDICETCSIQLIQVMTDQGGKPYFSCADIRISNTPPKSGDVTGTPAPSPMPSPSTPQSAPTAPTNLKVKVSPKT
ncbi:MAG: lytic polysaccharide monooxygenase [Deltaproteobacteria bacterium]|nr:lytic polysaccharide monooxygenase [Deltaproteobacteria bacterium]